MKYNKYLFILSKKIILSNPEIISLEFLLKTLTMPAATGTQNGKFRRHFHIKSCLNSNDGG